MRVYVVFDHWKETDEKKGGRRTIEHGRIGAELDIHELESQNNIEALPTLSSLSHQLAMQGGYDRVVILNVIPLPILGFGASKIARPTLVVP